MDLGNNITEVIVACVTSLAAIALAAAGRKQKKKSRKEIAQVKDQLEFKTTQARRQMEFQSKALAFSLVYWNTIHADLKDLCNETEVDRFIVLQAVNGIADPRWATALFQYRGGDADEKPVSYVNVELDADYVRRLKKVREEGELTFSVEGDSSALIHSIYRNENIRASAWFMIGTSQLSEGMTEITYCSFATHSHDMITDNTMTRCRLISSIFKAGHKNQMRTS